MKLSSKATFSRKSIWALSLILLCALGAGLVLTPPRDLAPSRHRFGDLDIVFIMGGAPGQPISDTVAMGVRAAERDLGCKVEMRWTHWSEERITGQLTNAIESAPDGICLIGFPAQDALVPLIESAFEEGIAVTSLNVPFDGLESRYAAQGFGYAGQDLAGAGQRLGAAVRRYFDLAPGTRVALLGAFSTLARSVRPLGCLEALEQSGLRVDRLDVDAARAQTPPLSAEQVLLAHLKENDDVRLCVYDGGPMLPIANALKMAGVSADRLPLAGFDVDLSSAMAAEMGYARLLLDQQPFLQGYLPVLQICLTRRFGVSGLHFDTGGSLYDGSTAASGPWGNP
ncbi:MAG: substrate-binding domain-containing protein [Candidatus Hydrogenedentes bacterium]|nr:substrate-binding domain-containing protein [Candidatus Hydrogenedentota bacterium]